MHMLNIQSTALPPDPPKDFNTWAQYIWKLLNLKQ